MKATNARSSSGTSPLEARVKTSVITWICMMEKYLRRLWLFRRFSASSCTHTESIIRFDAVAYMRGILKIFTSLGYMNIVKR